MKNNYHYYISNFYLILALKPIKNENLKYFKFILNLEMGNFNNIVLDLTSYEIIDKSTINFINRIINFFKMYDINAYIIGIRAETAYFLSNLNIKLNANTYLSLDRVINHDK